MRRWTDNRVLAESAAVAAACFLLVCGGMMIAGMYLTQHYVPDIVSSYENVDYLDHRSSVDFGRFGDNMWLTAGIASLCAGVLYYCIRIGAKSWKRTRMNRR